MKEKSNKISGLTWYVGIVVTVLIWIIFYTLETLTGLPPLPVHPLLRTILLIMFSVDCIYLVGGSMLVLSRAETKSGFVKSGPYMFVRHPLYSALIYSITGFLALWFYSWGLLISVFPLAFLWSWLVVGEERKLLEDYGREYADYCSCTGQFFPDFKNIDKKFS